MTSWSSAPRCSPRCAPVTSTRSSCRGCRSTSSRSRSWPRSARRSGTPTTLFALVRRAVPYTELTREAVRRSDRARRDTASSTGRGPRGRYVLPRRDQRRGARRAGARLAALTSGGAIPEIGDYRVRRRARRHSSSAPSTKTGPSSRWRATSSCSARTRGRSGASKPASCASRDAGDRAADGAVLAGRGAGAHRRALGGGVAAARARRRAARARRRRRCARVARASRPASHGDAATMIVDYLAVGRAVLGVDAHAATRS